MADFYITSYYSHIYGRRRRQRGCDSAAGWQLGRWGSSRDYKTVRSPLLWFRVAQSRSLAHKMSPMKDASSFWIALSPRNSRANHPMFCWFNSHKSLHSYIYLIAFPFWTRRTHPSWQAERHNAIKKVYSLDIYSMETEHSTPFFFGYDVWFIRTIMTESKPTMGQPKVIVIYIFLYYLLYILHILLTHFLIIKSAECANIQGMLWANFSCSFKVMHHFIFEFIEATLESPLVFQFFCKPIEGMGWAKKRQPWVNYGLIKYSYTKMFGHIHRWTGTPMNGMEWSGPGHGPGTWSVLLCSKPNAIVFYSSMHISPTSCTMANTHPNRQTRTLSPRVLQFRESCSPGVLEPCSY